MGLFAWHECREPGCDASLFIPLFAKDKPDSQRWQDYLAEKARWHFSSSESDVRCPAHSDLGLDSDVRRT